MRAVFVVLAVVVGSLGIVMLLAASQGNAVPRIVVGIILVVAAGSLAYMARMRPVEKIYRTEQVVELSGDVKPQQLKCEHCGGSLGPDSVKVRAGGIFVDCAYCGSSYQLEEAPKW
jgi:hypothetical protein